MGMTIGTTVVTKALGRMQSIFVVAILSSTAALIAAAPARRESIRQKNRIF